jgi:hypothetical protein
MWNGINCDDVPSIYWEVFENSFYASVLSFVGGGIGATKGCIPTAVTGPKSYLLCVGAGASAGAIVGGTIAFGAQMFSVWWACSRVHYPLGENAVESLSRGEPPPSEPRFGSR